MPYRPKCLECGNEADFREYEIVVYTTKYIDYGKDGWGKDSETDAYYDADESLFPPLCLVCKSDNVEYDNR